MLGLFSREALPSTVGTDVLEGDGESYVVLSKAGAFSSGKD